ncbi:MAG: D-alanine--D-alanine ligase [Oscillospiraceae bacterium]|nr:D-alanine--D-alanine ligase [Oscillospiraceae bacterium]
MKIKLAVFFGGKSVEHEVSVITALQAVKSLDNEKYEIIPVYIDKNNCMYTGILAGKIEYYTDIPNLIRQSIRVIPVREGEKILLVKYPSRFGKKVISEIDIAFPLGHGTTMEDGVFQGLLQFLGVPFVGCNVLSAACGMNKYVQKILLKNEGIPVLNCIKITSKDYFSDTEKIVKLIAEKVGFPTVIKPINLGSSVGIKIAQTQSEAADSIEHAFLFAHEIIIETAVQNLREVNVAVLGDCDEAVASECEEPLAGDEILSYKDKYLSNSAKGKSQLDKSSGMASLSRKIPAEIPTELREKIRKIAIESFKILGCSGVARVDFLYNNSTGELFYNEINTVPGSLAYYLWEPVGIKYPALLDKLINLALKRERENKNVNFSFETNILSGARLSKLGGKNGK